MAHADFGLEYPHYPPLRAKRLSFPRVSTFFSAVLRTRARNTVPQMDAHMMRDIGLSPDAHWLREPDLRANRDFHGILY